MSRTEVHDEQRCPRRDEGFPAVSAYPATDNWNERGSVRTCSYCGSLHPDDVFAAIEAFGELGPTDKTYKVYVHLPQAGQKKFYFQHFTTEEQRRFVELLNDGRIKFRGFGGFYVAPYFIRFAGGA